ncbi:MAG: acyltransferase [Candidatus Shapirobacteria bacterium]|jgi:acetyltransferase-like isoleucine patch superfamily enzyme
MFNIIFGIYNYFIKKGFYHFGKNSSIKPFLNTTNKKYISIGDNVSIGSFAWIGVDTDFAGIKCKSKNKIRLKIGDNSTIGNNSIITANNSVLIGKNCILSAYVFISDHVHEYNNISKNLNQQPLSENGSVIIGDNVFIGTKASIMRNVTIGERSVIGANTVVTKDIPSYSVVVGNPGKIIKRYDFIKKDWIKF